MWSCRLQWQVNSMGSLSLLCFFFNIFFLQVNCGLYIMSCLARSLLLHHLRHSKPQCQWGSIEITGSYAQHVFDPPLLSFCTSLSFLLILKLTHFAFLSSTPYPGDWSYLLSYLCPFTILPISSYLNILISLPHTQHPHCISPRQEREWVI